MASRGGAKSVEQDSAALAKAKSEERKAQLEAFRAAQAARRVENVTKATEQNTTATAKAPKSRVNPGAKSSTKSQQQDPNSLLQVKKAASASPERKPPVPTRAACKARPKSGVPPKGKAATAQPTTGSVQVQGPPKPAANASQAGESAKDTSKAGSWLEATQAFGFETPRLPESRRPTQTGEPASASLGPGFGDDGDPYLGIRWQIQLECLRLQQWKILNARLGSAMTAQQNQAEMQIRQAAEAVIALKEKVFEERSTQNRQRNAQHANEALAAQMPRLQLYSNIKEEHEASMEKITNAVATALQQMPLVNGAICGSSEAVDTMQMCRALQNIQNVLTRLEPCFKPFADLAAEAGKENQGGGLCATAHAAEALADVDEELRSHLHSNKILLDKLEHDVMHIESLAAHLLDVQETS